MPYPKAVARKATRNERKPGATRIVTDTPEKEEIKKQKENKQQNNMKSNPKRERSVEASTIPEKGAKKPRIEKD